MSEWNATNACAEVSLEVPARLECRNIVMRTVSAACRLASVAGDGARDFGYDVLSAVGEAYNNIVLHGYAGRERGSVQMKIHKRDDCVRVELRDTGASFDPTQAPKPDLAELPENGLGIFLMRSMVDEVFYVAGCPNVLTLVKRLDRACATQSG
jgi:anti-sigma regulatory factor (Ser/Thr protein kinase)